MQLGLVGFFAFCFAIFGQVIALTANEVAFSKDATHQLMHQNITLFDFGMFRLKSYLSGITDTVKTMDSDIVGIFADYDKERKVILIQLFKDYNKVSNSDADAENECRHSFDNVRKLMLVDEVLKGERKHSYVANLFTHFTDAGEEVNSEADDLDKIVMLQRIGKKRICEATLMGGQITLVSR